MSRTQQKTLQSRTEKIDFNSALGHQSIITAQSNLAQRGGFYCATCDVLLKDSRSFTIHINGRNHQKKLNISMHIRRVQPDEVLTKLKALSLKHPHAYESQGVSLEQLNVQTQLEIDQAYGTFDGFDDDDGGDDSCNDNDDDDGSGYEVIFDNEDIIEHQNKKQKFNNNNIDNDNNNAEMDDNNDHVEENNNVTIAVNLLNGQDDQTRTFEIAIDDGDWDDDDYDYDDEEEGVEYIKNDINNGDDDGEIKTNNTMNDNDSDNTNDNDKK